MSGWSSCDRSGLTLSETSEVARADHGRTVTACRRGLEACDRSMLSRPEAVALAVAEHDRNVSNCTDGIGACDESRLTRAEAADVAASDRIDRWTHGAGIVALAVLARAVFVPGGALWSAGLAAGVIGSAVVAAVLMRSRPVPTLAQVIATKESDGVVVPARSSYRGGAEVRPRGGRKP